MSTPYTPAVSRRTEFFAGIRAQVPLLLGVAPFGMAYGAYAVKTGLSAGLAQSMSAIVFGGASQFVGVRLIGNDVPGAVIVGQVPGCAAGASWAVNELAGPIGFISAKSPNDAPLADPLPRRRVQVSIRIQWRQDDVSISGAALWEFSAPR